LFRAFLLFFPPVVGLPPPVFDRSYAIFLVRVCLPPMTFTLPSGFPNHAQCSKEVLVFLPFPLYCLSYRGHSTRGDGTLPFPGTIRSRLILYICFPKEFLHRNRWMNCLSPRVLLFSVTVWLRRLGFPPDGPDFFVAFGGGRLFRVGEPEGPVSCGGCCCARPMALLC